MDQCLPLRGVYNVNTKRLAFEDDDTTIAEEKRSHLKSGENN